MDDNRIKAVYPVLSTATTYLTERSEIGAAFVNYILSSPGRTSDSHEDLLVAFRTIASELGHLPNDICSALSEKVKTVLNRYFPDDLIDTNFTVAEFKDESRAPNERGEDPRYAIKFDVVFIKQDGTKEPAVVSGSFRVNEDESISLSFN